MLSITLLFCFAPISLLWAQTDKKYPTLIWKEDAKQYQAVSDIAKYGLIHREPVQKASPDLMPILNPREYDARIQLWSPPFEWFNSMPVIPGSEQKADSVNYWWDPNSTQKESEQHK